MKIYLFLPFLFFTFLSSAQLMIINDYDEGLKMAQNLDKPIFILFSGKTCISTIKVEKALFEDPEINEVLRNHFVIVVLYVDDQTPLDRPYETRWDSGSFLIRKQGMKWADLEFKKFGYLTQLVFGVINKDEKVLVPASPISPGRIWIDDILPKLHF